jgi:DNA-directed RNA polymerase specialized sigma54-like protein
VLLLARIHRHIGENGWLASLKTIGRNQRGRAEGRRNSGAIPCRLHRGRQSCSTIQALDPLGIGARDLHECLLIRPRSAREKRSRKTRGMRSMS